MVFVCARRFLKEMHTRGQEACDAALHRMKMENVQPGDELPKVEHAKDSDRFLVSRVVTVPLPSFQYGEKVYAGINCRMKWAIASKDFEVELTERNLRYWFAALAASPQLPKKEKKAKDQDQQEDANEGPQDDNHQADPNGNSHGENAGDNENEFDENTAGDQNGVKEGEHDEEEKAAGSPKKKRKLKRRRSDVEGGSPPKKDRKP